VAVEFLVKNVKVKSFLHTVFTFTAVTLHSNITCHDPNYTFMPYISHEVEVILSKPAVFIKYICH